MNELTIKELITAVFEWAYYNDTQLYLNMDDVFVAHSYRSSKNRLDLIGKLIKDNFNVKDCLKRAITLCDYEDIVNFNVTFKYCTRSRKGSYSYTTENPYKELIPFIDAQMKYLEDKGLDWHRSENQDKHSHFRWWINHFLTNDKYYKLNLLVENDTRCWQILPMTNKSEDTFSTILNYIIDNNICPDPHHKSLTLLNTIDDHSYNGRIINQSGNYGGFWYLVYLKATELMDIYNSLNKRNIDYLEKANWQFINHVAKHEPSCRFYIFIP